jgi:hypothetical protein
MAKTSKNAFKRAIEHLKNEGIIKRDKDLLPILGLTSPGSLSNYINGIPSKEVIEKFQKKYSIDLADFEDDHIEIPDSIQYLTEKIIKIEAGMEVERSLLIDLLAIASKKTTTEISTKVAEALDYQISKRMAELKQQ